MTSSAYPQASGWEISDPKAIYLWFRDHFDDSDRTKVRRQVRYFKARAALKFVEISNRPSSILLTVLVSRANLACLDWASGVLYGQAIPSPATNVSRATMELA
jgi:hypothetical protein